MLTTEKQLVEGRLGEMEYQMEQLRQNTGQVASQLGEKLPGTAGEHWSLGCNYLMRSFSALFCFCRHSQKRVHKRFEDERAACEAGPLDLMVVGASQNHFGESEALRQEHELEEKEAQLAAERERVSIAVDDWETSNANVIFPCEPWKENWDTLMVGLILYSAVMVPFRVCFSAEAEGNAWYFEVGVTFLFITDLLINFNTAFAGEGADVDRYVVSK